MSYKVLFSKLSNKIRKQAMPKMLGKDGEGNVIFEDSTGKHYKEIDGRYYIVNDKFAPEKEIPKEEIEKVASKS